MNINYLTLMMGLLSTICIVLIFNGSLRKGYVNWIYLFSGGLSLYLIETTTHEQSFQNTLLMVVALYLIPMTIDGFISNHKKH